jgi:formyltetrahydrofolate hydrolase
MKDTAVLLIDCPDRKGLVARVSSLLYDFGANILHADQHQDHDLGLFFMRVEFALAAPASALAAPTPASPARFDLESFRSAFQPLADELNMRWQLTASASPTPIALFCSQYLHCMADLLYRWHSGELPCHIALILSNHRHVEPLAVFYGIPFELVPRSLMATILLRQASQRVSSGQTSTEQWLGGWGSVVSHPKASRVAARFRVGTRLLPNLVLSEDKASAAWDEAPISGGPHHP